MSLYKKIISVMVIFIFCQSLTAFAGTEARCVRKSKGELIEDKVIAVKLDGRKVYFKTKDGYVIRGTFIKKLDNGSYMYGSEDMQNLADQSQYGRIFVSPGLAKGKNGNFGLSIRQAGDSEGSWLLKDLFYCTVL